MKKIQVKDVVHEKCVRKTFSKIGDFVEIPNLLKVQKDSYEWFIKEGLGEVLKDISPIADYSGNLVLEFFDYYMEDTTKYSLEESKERDATYSTRLHVKVRLINRETGEIKEQEIYLGDFPLMTDSGTFVINGAERVVVSQLVRSPGCYYAFDYDKTKLYTATVMPIRGAWIEYETDSNDVFWVRIDRTRKLPVTCLLRALGLDTDEKIIEAIETWGPLPEVIFLCDLSPELALERSDKRVEELQDQFDELASLKKYYELYQKAVEFVENKKIVRVIKLDSRKPVEELIKDVEINLK